MARRFMLKVGSHYARSYGFRQDRNNSTVAKAYIALKC